MDSETAMMDGDQVAMANPTDTATSMELLPSQMANLEMINHLASYSELMVLVIGPTGSGKSYLAAALDQAKSEKTSVITVAAAGLAGVPDLSQRIADHWGLGRMPEVAEQQRQLLMNAAQYHDGQGNGLLVIIDNAELLDTDTLNEIAVMAKLVRQGLAIVLCGDSGFELQLRASISQAECHPIILTPLSNLEIRQLARQYYVKHKSKSSTDLPLEQILETLSDAAEWYPADVLHHIDQQVEKAAVAGGLSKTVEGLHDNAPAPTAVAQVGPEDRAAASAISGTRLLLTLTLLVGVVVGIILFDKNPTFSTSEVTDYPADEIENIEEIEDIKVSPEAASITDPVITALNNEAPSEKSRGSASPLLTDGSTPSTTVDSNLSTASDQNQQGDDIPSSVIPAPQVPVMIDQTAGAETITKISPAPVMELADRKSIQQPAGEVSPSAPQPVLGSDSDVSLLLAADSGYVVQLMGASQRTSAAKFIQDWQPKVAKQLYQYKTEFRSKDWFVVVLGIFPDRSSARSAVAQLPLKLRSAKPWVRPLTDVQKALE